MTLPRPFPLEYLILPYVVWLGVRVSLHDYRTNTIPNRYIRQSTVVGLVWVVLLMAWKAWPVWRELQVFGYEHWPYPLIMALNIALCWVIGFLLWYFDLWSAGDGKLLGVWSFFLTPGMYTHPLVDYFPGFVHLFNTFFIVFVIICTELFVSVAWSAVRNSTSIRVYRRMWTWLRSNAVSLLRTAVTMLLLVLLVINSRKYAAFGIRQIVQVDEFTMYLLLFLVFERVRHFVERPGFWKLVVPIYLAWLGLEVYHVETTPGYDYSHMLRDVAHFSTLTLFLLVFSTVYYGLSPLYFRHRLHPRELKQGQTLSAETIARIEGSERFATEFASTIGDLRRKALTGEDLDHLREWYAHQPERYLFLVEKHIPFAPGLFIGGLVTVVLGGPILHVKF